MKQLRCGEIIEGCEAILEAETEEELLQKVGTHAHEAHGFDEVPQQVVEEVRKHIRDI